MLVILTDFQVVVPLHHAVLHIVDQRDVLPSLSYS